MNENELKTEWATRYKKTGMSQAQMIIEHYPNNAAMLLDADLWPTISDEQSEFAGVDIVTPKQNNWQPSILELYSDSVRKSVKFPPNTCFLHGLGCLSAAMSRQFTYIPYQGSDENRPVNLFCVSGQPPSTGKSGVNNAFMIPIRIAYEAINQSNRSEKKKLEGKIASLRKELQGATNGSNQHSFIEGELMKHGQQMQGCIDYITDVNDSTPEGLSKLMGKQEGWANIVSAEAEAIEVMLGNVYSDSSKKSNSGVFLAMWAGEWVSIQRAGSEGFRGMVRGSCAVLAQPDTVKSVLEAGKLGRGISERFLLINEPHMLGQRDHQQYKPVDKKLKAEYIDLVSNIVNTPMACFQFDSEAHHLINEYRNSIEVQMSDSGQFNDSMIRGTMGKSGEQIQKIACIMWASQEWAQGGKQRLFIGRKTTQRAIEIFDELSRTYLQAAEESGCAGLKPKINIVMSLLAKRFAKLKKDKKQPKVTAQQLQQTLKNNKAFASTGKLTSYIRDTIMPELVLNGAVILARGEYYINPRVMEVEE